MGSSGTSPTEPNSETWSEWLPLEGILQSPPAIGRNADGRLQVFVRGTDGRLWHRRQIHANSQDWSDWQFLKEPRTYADLPWTDQDDSQKPGGTPIGINDPQVIANRTEELEVFVRSDANGALWHIRQSNPNSDEWEEWSSLGGVLVGSPALGRNVDGRIVRLCSGGRQYVVEKIY